MHCHGNSGKRIDEANFPLQKGFASLALVGLIYLAGCSEAGTGTSLSNAQGNLAMTPNRGAVQGATPPDR
jgi:hypothetical protein